MKKGPSEGPRRVSRPDGCVSSYILRESFSSPTLRARSPYGSAYPEVRSGPVSARVPHRIIMRDLVFVSAGLDLAGGGRAAAGRLLAVSSAAYAEERGIDFSILSLGEDSSAVGGTPARSFAGRQGALALAAWRRHLAGPPAAFVYDLLGPARIEAWLPGPLRAPYL